MASAAATAIPTRKSSEIIGIPPSQRFTTASLELLSVIPAQMIATTTKATDALKEFYFCGRVNVLESIQTILNLTMLENKNHPCRRTMVIFQGIGGIGKTQTALEYVRRNRNIYSTVFWVDISNASRLTSVPIESWTKLITHYAKKYPGEEKFGSIAADLQIPGQIDRQGQLRGNAAKSPWQCVRKWLARDANIGWCLVVDGINDEADGDRMLELLPACDHGHIIATSRVRLSDFKIIEIPELEEQFSVKMLLDRRVDSLKDEDEAKPAAEQVAEMIGYLPLALSQAAAYIKKKALRLVQYLGRLRNNIARLIGEKFLKFSGGVFSCWELSIQELVKSYAHAFDLLRLCSFLSPNGISEELLYRGLEAIEDGARLVTCLVGLDKTATRASHANGYTNRKSGPNWTCVSINMFRKTLSRVTLLRRMTILPGRFASWGCLRFGGQTDDCVAAALLKLSISLYTKNKGKEKLPNVDGHPDIELRLLYAMPCVAWRSCWSCTMDLVGALKKSPACSIPLSVGTTNSARCSASENPKPEGIASPEPGRLRRGADAVSNMHGELRQG
ncbi:uncharacterized protein BDCG_16486 [Blastomyces dermatitidis ER-3]|nr:uncharacterized protein BDCG_16486 [Blastomyces dermatitidis ER-3]OAT00134.1 hypothetical protein BDCG_16486 [Blastomyces dermatitidis ER-3]